MFKKSAQTAMEFTVLIALVLFFFSIFLLIIQENISEKMNERKTVAVEEVAFAVQDEINLAHKSSDGYYREFEMPDEINGMGYEINITENRVYIRTTDNKYAIALPVLNVTGDILKDNNIIKKENGEVLLNQ